MAKDQAAGPGRQKRDRSNPHRNLWSGSRSTEEQADLIDIQAAIKRHCWPSSEGLRGRHIPPEFWDDYLGSPNKQGVYESWQAKIADEERIAGAKREKELAQKIMTFNRAVMKRGKELEDLRGLREQDRQERLVEERRKKKQRRKRPKAEVTIVPEEIRIFAYRQVSTPWGRNYILVAYEGDATQLIRVEPDGKLKVVLSGRHAYQISESPSGLLHLIPVIGTETGR